jgi:nicotinamide mononucleotide transporter
MIDALDALFATLLQDPLEVTAVAFGILSVWLSTREHLASWPTAMVNVALFFIIFLRARLYADMGLQAIYFGLSAYGWYEWRFGGTGRTILPVGRTTVRTAAWLAALAVAGTLGLGTYLDRATDAALPYLDSALAVCSLLAQWMMTRKLLENWLAWIVLDVLYVGMFLSRDLALTAVNYAVYLALAMFGFIHWRRSWAAQQAAA